jgi:hypothetical protein
MQEALPSFKTNDVLKRYLLKMIVILAQLQGIVPAKRSEGKG